MSNKNYEKEMMVTNSRDFGLNYCFMLFCMKVVRKHNHPDSDSIKYCFGSKYFWCICSSEAAPKC